MKLFKTLFLNPKNIISDGQKFNLIKDKVFPFIKEFHTGIDSSYARHMKDALFMIQTPALLEKVVEMISKIPMEDRDTKQS